MLLDIQSTPWFHAADATSNPEPLEPDLKRNLHIDPKIAFQMILCLAVLAAVCAQRSFGLLAETRPNITFVAYTPQQRIQVAKTVENLLSVYVNREEKIKYYGRIMKDIDPIPRAKAIQAEAANLTDRDFHYRYAELFVSLRDFQ